MHSVSCSIPLLLGLQSHLQLQVSLPVVRKFVKQVEETALGVKVVKGIKPNEQLVKVVSDQLIELMGGEQQDLVKPARGPQVSRL